MEELKGGEVAYGTLRGPTTMCDVARDLVGMSLTREASHALDTVNANCWLLGLRIRYV